MSDLNMKGGKGYIEESKMENIREVNQESSDDQEMKDDFH